MLTRILGILLLLFSTMNFAGCLNKTVEITDNSTIRPTVMVSKQLTERLGIQASFYGTKGDSPLILEEDERILIDEPPIQGPISMDSEFSLMSGNLVFDFTLLDSPYIDLHLFTGINTTILNLDFVSGNHRREFQVANVGGTVRFQADAKITEDITASLSMKACSLWGDSAISYEPKVALAYSFSDSFAIWGGWQWWHYEYRESPSDVIIDTSGPAFGVHLFF